MSSCQKITTGLCFSLIHHLPSGAIYKNFAMSSFDKLCVFIDSAAVGEIKDYISRPWLRDEVMMHSDYGVIFISILKQSFAMQQPVANSVAALKVTAAAGHF